MEDALLPACEVISRKRRAHALSVSLPGPVHVARLPGTGWLKGPGRFVQPVAAMVEHIIGAPYDVFQWGPPKPPCDQARLQVWRCAACRMAWSGGDGATSVAAAGRLLGAEQSLSSCRCGGGDTAQLCCAFRSDCDRRPALGIHLRHAASGGSLGLAFEFETRGFVCMPDRICGIASFFTEVCDRGQKLTRCCTGCSSAAAGGCRGRPGRRSHHHPHMPGATPTQVSCPSWNL